MEKQQDLYERLAALAQSDAYPFHMPGHKRNPWAGLPEGFAQLDITEIENFDNLHHAQGILKEAMCRASELYGSERTYFLVNGSTCGVLSAVSSVVSAGDTLILGRNAHMSAYHGAYLRGCGIVSLYPERLQNWGIYGAVSPERTAEVLARHPEAKAVMITSPTYDGFVSDVRKIADTVHACGKILIVDEAHGAHFGMDARLPESSVRCGADLVIHSLHKTLPSLTQTALLHVNGARVDRERLERFLRIYQSSSPSYLLMGSIDRCIRGLQQNRQEWFDAFFEKRKRFLAELAGLRTLIVVSGKDILGGRLSRYGGRPAGQADPAKLLILCGDAGKSGAWLQRLLLEKYHIQTEMAGAQYVLAIVTVMDTDEGLTRLARALREIDAALSGEPERVGDGGGQAAGGGKTADGAQTIDSGQTTDSRQAAGSGQTTDSRQAAESRQTTDSRQAAGSGQTVGGADVLEGNLREKECAAAQSGGGADEGAEEGESVPDMTLAQAMDERCTEPVKLEETPGRIVTEFVYAYPPGSPVILPGERMTRQTLALMESDGFRQLHIQGPEDESLRTLRCVKESRDA